MLVSVVTACLNRRDMLAQAINSLAAQTCDRFEHIVVDGGSTDGTLEMLARHPGIRAVSERDDGVYDAMNKGIAMCRGEVVCLLNSDDLLPPDALATAVAGLSADRDCDMVCGGIEIFADSSDGRVVLTRIDDDGHKGLREADITRGHTLTNARFYRRSVFDRLGGFDTRFPIAADRDFLLRARLAGMTSRPVPGIVYRYRSHAGSLTFGTEQAREKYLREYVDLALTRLGETGSDAAAGAAYGRWAAWASGYLAAYLARRGRLSAAAKVAGAAFGRDPAWPFSFIGQAAAHAAGVRQRRGRPTGRT